VSQKKINTHKSFMDAEPTITGTSPKFYFYKIINRLCFYKANQLKSPAVFNIGEQYSGKNLDKGYRKSVC
jgi:hypothetical protein